MRRLTIFVIVLIVVIAGSALWWKNGISSSDPSNQTPKIFVVAKGEGVREIANKLKKEGLIRDPIVFFLLTKKMGIDKEIQAGDFRLNPSMNLYQIVENLRHGTLDIWVTLPEGLRADEIAGMFKTSLPNYKPEWRNILVVNEGYLFPDTYLFPKDADINAIVDILKNNFNNKYATLGTLKTNLSQEEIVIIASLIERETRHDEDRPLVGSVIKNRLELGMKLDIDATIQYALGYQEGEKRWWKKLLTEEDKLLNSPYNTYKVAGLPPGPISNPGLASLKAAINPANTSYLYYITDKNGINRYAEDIKVHNENIRKYGL